MLHLLMQLKYMRIGATCARNIIEFIDSVEQKIFVWADYAFYGSTYIDGNVIMDELT